MPVKSNSYNRILPANGRASDVASRAVQEIMPVQQARNYSAMRVQGYAGLLYSHLTQGRKCTCVASGKHLNSRLGLDGKAKPGVINELMTGALTFDVSAYGAVKTNYDPLFNETSPDAINKHQGVFDMVVEDETDYGVGRVTDGPSFGDNGPLGFDIDTLVTDFDTSSVGMTDASCAVCFGHGFVGGYSPFHANRLVYTVNDVILGNSELDVSAAPWTAESDAFAVDVVLPYGALGVDVFRVLNNTKPVSANFTIDGQPANLVTVLRFCDGRPHRIGVTLPRTKVWTHLELQFVLSDQSAYFEFPKLNKGSDTSMLEQMDPFQIIMSSNVPSLKPNDIIVDSTFGKTLIVQNSSWWNTRNRDVLGWECQVRVLQPQEIYGLLPKRGRIMTKPPTATMVHDNITGTHRT